MRSESQAGQPLYSYRLGQMEEVGAKLKHLKHPIFPDIPELVHRGAWVAMSHGGGGSLPGDSLFLFGLDFPW